MTSLPYQGRVIFTLRTQHKSQIAEILRQRLKEAPHTVWIKVSSAYGASL